MIRKAKEEHQFGKFMEILKQIHINIPLIEAIQQMPNYSKFTKNVLAKRKRVREFAIVELTPECNQFVQGKLPHKLKVPESFTIPCNIGDSLCGRALCNLGVSINPMPLYIFKKLGIGATRPNAITLQLADQSISYPHGKIEDVLVREDSIHILVIPHTTQGSPWIWIIKFNCDESLAKRL